MQTDAVSYLDRRVTNTSSGVSVALLGGVTTWTLPYSIATDGSEGTLVVARTDTSVLLTSTRPSATTIAATGDFSTVPVYIGVLYPFTAILSPLFLRDRNGEPDVTGRFTVADVTFRAVEATALNVEVSGGGTGRATTSRSLTQSAPGPLTLLVPVRLPNDRATVAVRITTPGAIALAGISWRGSFNPQSARKI